MRNVCKETRAAKSMTQQEFAEYLGVTRQTIIRWERDPDAMPLTAMVSILTADTREAV